MSSIESYRGTVYRWEVDNVDHFTVAYYFERFEDATIALLHALGLDHGGLAGTGHACVTLDSHVRYLRELRVGDILHVQSGVIDVAADGLVIGHQVFDSSDGELCTSAAQRVWLRRAPSRAPLPLDARRREAALSHRIDWDAAPVSMSAPSSHLDSDKFLETTRDTIKPKEVDVVGQAAFAAYIHRFSAANGHMLADFGMTPAYMRAEGRGFSTFEFKLRLPGALRAGDLVRVRTALVHVGASSLRMLHRMTNVRTGEEVSTLEQSGVHLDTRARRSCPLPESMRERAMARLVAPAPRTEHPPARSG